MVRQGFLRAVTSQRGDKLKISEEELSKAGVYNGIQGLRYGLIDEMGASSDAIQKAAELAGIRNYEVVDINKELGLLPPWYEIPSFRASPDLEAMKASARWLPQYYYLYIPPEVQE